MLRDFDVSHDGDEWIDTYITVYNPAEEVLELIGSLAGSEGLFIWR